MADQDGYPTDEELQAITNYDVLRLPVMGLVELIKESWHWGVQDGWLNKRQTRLYLATGGWSGNEEIITALEKNFMFWSLCWYKSMRGGADWFHLDDAPNHGKGWPKTEPLIPQDKEDAG